jgi:hypothetical protein
MPRDDIDRDRLVVEVPFDRLVADRDRPELQQKVEGFLRKFRPELFDHEPAATDAAPEPVGTGEPDPFT